MTINRLKKVILFVVLPLFMSCSACENKLFHFSVPFPVPHTFNIDDTDGTFSEVTTVTANDILDALDLPSEDEICIKSVSIRGISLKPVVGADNGASSVTVSGQVSEDGSLLHAFQNYPLPLPTGLATEFVVDQLIEAGINRIRGKIEGFILGLDSQSFNIVFSGDSSPAGSRIQVDITLSIQGTIEYDQCVEVWDFLSISEDCPDPLCQE